MNVQLNKICQIRMGYSFRGRPNFSASGHIPVIQPKDVNADGRIEAKDLLRIEVAVGKPLVPGDVLLINRGRFTAAVFDERIGDCCVATSAFMILTPNDPEQILPEYLMLFLNSAEGQRNLKRLNETTTIPFLSLSNLEVMEVPVPPIEQQREIVVLGEMNRAYARLSARKIELQNQIVTHFMKAGRMPAARFQKEIA
ncbi:MAG: restriction endonuclease subunit S [Kiritimatiellia bacterium]